MIYIYGGPIEEEFMQFDAMRQQGRVLSDGYCDAGLTPNRAKKD